jgi:hypothetical protein
MLERSMNRRSSENPFRKRLICRSMLNGMQSFMSWLNNVHFMGDGIDESANARRVRRGAACHHTGEMQSRGNPQASFAQRLKEGREIG